MATQTKILASFDDGACAWELDYSDTSLKLLTIRCVNTTTATAVGEFISQADPTFRQHIEVTPAQSPFSQAIPINVQNKYAIGIDAHGRLTGVDFQFYMKP